MTQTAEVTNKSWDCPTCDNPNNLTNYGLGIIDSGHILYGTCKECGNSSNLIKP